jgi:hypothetical protein
MLMLLQLTENCASWPALVVFTLALIHLGVVLPAELPFMPKAVEFAAQFQESS